MNLPASLPTPTRSRAATARIDRRLPETRLEGRLAHLRDLVARGTYRVPTERLAEALLRHGALAPLLPQR